MERKHIHDERGMDVPQEILDQGVNFPRDLDKLHALELPMEVLAVSELEWHLDLPFFWQEGSPFSLKPREVLNNLERYEYRANRILGVDVSFPIDVIWWNGRWVILDGLHRLCQQVLAGKQVVKVRKLPPEWVERILPD